MSHQDSAASAASPPAERRRSDRAGLVVRVDYRTIDDLFSEFARNINEGGIFVETDAPHEVGTTVNLQFRLPGGEEPVRVKGTVVRVAAGPGPEPHGMGIEFENLDSVARMRINELVKALKTSR